MGRLHAHSSPPQMYPPHEPNSSRMVSHFLFPCVKKCTEDTSHAFIVDHHSRSTSVKTRRLFRSRWSLFHGFERPILPPSFLTDARQRLLPASREPKAALTLHWKAGEAGVHFALLGVVGVEGGGSGRADGFGGVGGDEVGEVGAVGAVFPVCRGTWRLAD